MKVQVFKCCNDKLWYNNVKFPIKTEVEEASVEKNGEAYNIFFSLYNPEDFYYSKGLMGFVAKSDCFNDEEGEQFTTLDDSKQSFNYEYKARPWEPEFKPVEPTEKIKKDIIEFFSKQSNNFIHSETIKHDEGKTCVSDIPQLSLMSVAKVFNYGAKKYSKFNYSAGTDWLRYYDACQRHLNSWMIGDDIDESLCHHLDHAIASLMMLRENIHLNKGTDNRNKIYQ